MSSFEWEESVVVVTGSGSGIGRAIGLSAAARRARVVVSDIELDAAEETAGLIRESGGTAVAVPTDVTDPSEVNALADRAYEEFGRVDVLCNNAGVTMRPFRAVWDGSRADFRWMMEVNYFGVVHGLLAFLPRMRAQDGHKHIVNTSSMATLADVPGHGMYTASKAAVDGLSNVLRAELAEHAEDFGVTILYPGNISTRIGSSERLRAVAERSETRSVTPYPRRVQNAPYQQPIEPDGVGELVARAVETNAAFCLTHEAPVDLLQERLAEVAGSFVPAGSAAGPVSGT